MQIIFRRTYRKIPASGKKNINLLSPLSATELFAEPLGIESTCDSLGIIRIDFSSGEIYDFFFVRSFRGDFRVPFSKDLQLLFLTGFVSNDK